MNSSFKLREWKLSDKKSLAENANNINIWNYVRDCFPYPYTEADGEQFIRMVLNSKKPSCELAIEINNKAVGGIGIKTQSDVERISAEIGYWIGEKYWNKGIMTNAVKKMTDYVFANFPVKKLYAPVFDFNKASHRVLEKAGFKKEAVLKKAAVKKDKIIDLHYYSLIKDE